MKSEYLYDDKDDKFDRPPHVVTFKIENTDLSIDEFSLCNIHLKTTDVLNESLALRDVADKHFARQGQNGNLAILGDMNFDEPYIFNKNRNSVRDVLSEFQWFINDDVSTTTSAKLSALDRILIAGPQFINAVIPETNNTWRYDLEFGITSMSEVNSKKA
jgi:hypothetical protein